MGNLWFNAQRALFSQPLGMTLNAVRRKLSPERRTFTAEARGQLPIDAQYGIDTGGRITATALRSGASGDLHSYGYGASLPSVIRRAIETCPDVEAASFVDLGCGKGLPLAVASEYPFRRIVGVELSPTLCEVARANAERIAKAHPDRTPIEIVEGDITTAELPSGYLIAYLYNPAYPPLMSRIAKRLAEHQASGAKVMVIYYNPAAARFFDREPEFERYFAAHLEFEPDEAAASPLGNAADSIVVWQGRRAPMHPPLPGADARIAVIAGGSTGRVQPVGAA